MLTNPPFGTKGASRTPEREDFTVETSNKQLNFVQHVLTVLKPGGWAAVVLPDNCLFADQAGEVFEILTKDCDLHTVLRLPRGTFTPYSQGVKANVVFFTKSYRTKTTWIYDCRSNIACFMSIVLLRERGPFPGAGAHARLNVVDVSRLVVAAGCLTGDGREYTISRLQAFATNCGFLRT